VTNRVLNDIGDDILKVIQANRTPLTDALLKIIIFLVAATVFLHFLERFFESLQKKSGRPEEDQTSLRFIFIILQYITLLVALYMVLRAVVAEINATNTSRLEDVIQWLHRDTSTLKDYCIKYLVALVIFLVFHALQTGFFKFLKYRLSSRDISERFITITTNLVKYILLSFMIVASALQIMITGGTSILGVIIFAYICVVISVPVRTITAKLSSSSKTIEYVLTFAGQLFGVLIYAGVIFVLYLGLKSFLGSGGQEISDLLRLPEDKLSTELHTHFESNPDLSKSLSGTSSVPIVIHSDEELNIIYYKGKQVGIQTSGRKYQFYGISVNMPEVTAVHEMTYKYTGVAGEGERTLTGSSSAHYYYNKKENDCLVMTVNKRSNRIVSLTYYSDFDAVSKNRTLVEE